MATDNKPGLIDADAVAAILGLNRRQVYVFARKSPLRECVVKLGDRKVLFSRIKVEALIGINGDRPPGAS